MSQLIVLQTGFASILDDFDIPPQHVDVIEPINPNYYGRLIRRVLYEDEGVRYKAYKDSKGIWTIGVGHNLQEHPIAGKSLDYLRRVGLTPQQVDALFDDDLKRAENDARKLVPALDSLHPERKAVIVSLSFNMGLPTFSKFKKALAAANKEDWTTFQAELVDSKWYRDVGKRGPKLVAMVDIKNSATA